MRIAIVVADPMDWTAQALLASFTRKGADSFFLDFSELSANIDNGQHFSCAGIDLLGLDAIVIIDLGRRGPGDVAFRFEVLQALQERGIVDWPWMDKIAEERILRVHPTRGEFLWNDCR